MQDAHGLWWRSLEYEFKVRIKIIDDNDNINNNKIEGTGGKRDDKIAIDTVTDGIKIEIQGDQVPVAYASKSK